MTKTGVESVCSKCGAEIREGSVYCYGCGSPVADVAVVDDSDKKAASAEAIEAKDVAMSDLEIAHSSAVAQDPVRPRAGRRRVSKIEPKVVEVTWIEPESGSWRFIVSALVIVILGLGLVALGLYLR